MMSEGGEVLHKSRKPKRASHTGIAGINLRELRGKGGEEREGEEGREK
jgi:hypothetical protein